MPAVALLAFVIMLAWAGVAQAQTIVVNTKTDPTGTNGCLTGGTCSLRDAVAAASSGDTIQLGGTAGSPNDYQLTQGTDIQVGTSLSLTIEGAGVDATSIDGSQNFGSNQYDALARILRINGGTITIEDLTFTGGVDEEDENCSDGCDSIDANGGGALFNDGGDVTLDDVAFSDNSGSGTPLGGAVSNGSGTLGMTDVSFTDDVAANAGGLFVRGGTVTGNGVTFDGDETTCCDGGAAYLYGGSVTLTNTTVVDSSGLDGTAAIWNGDGTLKLDNDTFSGNGSDIATDPSGATTVENTILGTGYERGACTAPGLPDDLNDENSTNAITTDGGGNLDQDDSCGFTEGQNSDQVNANPRLASLSNNGGPTETEALVDGSAAFGAAVEADCPTSDQRGEPRANPCDVGAFEAQFTDPGTPTATTEPADSVEQTQADLESDVNFDGEAGGYHFLWGTSPTDLSNVTSEMGAGELSSPTPEPQTITGLSPGTTYYYQVVADDATSSASGATESFTTLSAPPVISNVIASVTDTTATIDFSVDPGGADTTYSVEYGPDSNYGQTTPTQDAGSGSTAVPKEVDITDLTPGTTYHFDVVAHNSNGPGDTGDQTLTTDQQITGTAGLPVTLTDSGNTDSCPLTATIDWGDGSGSQQANTDCTGGGEEEASYTLSENHTYAAGGHYPIVVDYSDGHELDEYAQITGKTILVTTAADPTGAGDCADAASGGECSLRQAIDFASSGDTIELGGAPDAPDDYQLTQGTDIPVDNTSLMIEGNGVDATYIDGSQNTDNNTVAPARMLKINGGTVTIRDLTFTKGDDGQDEYLQSGCSPCTTVNEYGGGDIYNGGGTVSVDDVAFTNNYSAGLGGGISNGSGSLSLSNVSFTGDGAAGGGALFVRSGSVTGTGVTFANDGSVTGTGGAAYVLGGSLSLTNATVVGDGGASNRGGGIVNAGGQVVLINDTLDGNDRGAIETEGSATTTVGNTIIGAGDADGGDFACIAPGYMDDLSQNTSTNAITTDDGGNIDQDGHCGLTDPTDESNVDPDLASLADNDPSTTQNPTETEALVNGSPAFGAANEDNCPDTDQRDVTRADPCDIGAFEHQDIGDPSATTEAAQDVEDTQADLEGDINFDGEAGGYRFLWGNSSTDLNNVIPETGAGELSSSTPESQTATGLSQGTTYYYEIVADNASGTATGAIRSFTTTGPSVASVSPSVGPASGGTSVTITGNNLANASAVDFGDNPATITSDTASQITATAPPGSGTVDVTVTTSDGTSSTSATDQYTYTTEGGGGSGGGSGGSGGGGVSGGAGGGSQPSAGSSVRPAIGTQPPLAKSSAAATFAGFVNPEGSSTTAYFEYGIDPSYTGGGSIVYSSMTPAVAVGAGSASLPVSGSASGLVPNALYHVRLVATNGAGTTHGPDQTFRTMEDPPPPPPVLGKSFDASVVSGLVFIKLPGGVLRDHLTATKGLGFVPLTEPRQLPAGTQVDSRLGTLQLVAASGAKHGKLQTGTFGGALFGLGQSGRGVSKGLTTLSMLEGTFSGAPSYASCKAKAAGDPPGAYAAKLSSKVLQTLHASAHGKFSTRGHYAAATVRGTAWAIADRCDGTFVHVTRHAVLVTDFVRHITVIVHAGHSYLARAP